MIAEALAIALAIGSLARRIGRRDADIAHRNLAALLAEQVAEAAGSPAPERSEK